MVIYAQNFFYFHIFSFILVFKHNFMRCVDFTRIAALNFKHSK